MKTTVALVLWLALGWICRAEQVLAEYDWQKLAAGGHLRGGNPIMLEGKAAVLEVSYQLVPGRTAEDGPLRFHHGGDLQILSSAAEIARADAAEAASQPGIAKSAVEEKLAELKAAKN